MADLYLKNAQVVTEEEVFKGGVLIEGEVIAEMVEGDPDLDARKVVDVGDKLLFPGIIDDHVHFNEPGRTHWEGYRTGTAAAAAGGVTTIMEMPLNATPPTINRELLAEKRRVVSGEALIDYANWGGLVNNNLKELAGLHQDGVIAFKGFLSDSGVDDFERIDDDLLYAGLQKVGELGNVLGLHAENEYVTGYLGREMRNSGRIDRAAWSESRPPESELEAIKRACFWAEMAAAYLHIVHITIAAGVLAVEDAKGRGVKVTSETCPHYLFFDEGDFEEIGPAAKCAPPLRSRQIVEDLWDCVLGGLIDVIGSDHSPCTWDEKAKGMLDIWKAWGGISGTQTMLPVILTEGVHKRGLPLTELVRMMSANPARIFGLYPTKGVLEPGSDADLTLVDLDAEWTLKSDDLFYKNKHSAYIGRTFKGRVEATYLRGHPVYRDGQIMVEPGYGKPQNRLYKYKM